MSRFVMGVLGLAMVTTVAISTVACSEEDPFAVGTGNLSDPATLEAVLRQTFLPGALGVIDGFERVITAVTGGTADGVTIIPTGNGATATIEIDFDGDGSREGMVNADFFGDITVGAQASVSSIQTPTVPSLTAAGAAQLQQTTPGSVFVTSIVGTGSADPAGDAPPATVSLLGGQVNVDLVTSVPDGFVNFSVFAEGNELFLTSFFESDGQGGFRVRFTGDGLDFTIP